MRGNRCLYWPLLRFYKLPYNTGNASNQLLHSRQ